MEKVNVRRQGNNTCIYCHLLLFVREALKGYSTEKMLYCRVTELQGLDGTSGDHRVQTPAKAAPYSRSCR